MLKSLVKKTFMVHEKLYRINFLSKNKIISLITWAYMFLFHAILFPQKSVTDDDISDANCIWQPCLAYDPFQTNQIAPIS